MNGKPTGVVPRALLLVRNTATHDARVLRAARVAQRLGYETRVLAVMSTDVRSPDEEIGGVAVHRVDPGGWLRPALRGLIDGGGQATDGVQEPRSAATSGPSRRRAPSPGRLAVGSALATVRRLVLTADFYRQGVGEVLRRRPALVHCNDYNTMWIGLAAKLLCRSGVVYDVHELWPDRNQRSERRWWLLACEALFLRVADRVITTSPGYAEEISRRYRVEAPNVVRNLPEQRPGAGSGTVDSHRIVYVGGLTSNRGIEQTIAALSRVEHAELELVGPGRSVYVDGLRHLAVEAGVEGRVRFRGSVPPDEVVEAVAGAAAGLALIQPSCLSYRLTLPNKLFEYLAAGLPVLASDLPVLGGFVRSEQIGVCVPPADEPAIAAGIERILDPALNRKLRERAEGLAAELTWERESAGLEQAYGEAVSR